MPDPANHLRLYPDSSSATSSAEAVPARHDDPPRVDQLCQAFERATTWPLRYEPTPAPKSSFDLLWSAPVNPGVGAALGHLRIERTADGRNAQSAGFPAAARLAEQLADTLADLSATGAALRGREAELAASFAVTVERSDSASLARRLEAVLQGGAAAIGCVAAGAYLLNQATTQLKLRASCGLPPNRLAAETRPLDEALADLEALSGHTVVMENQEMVQAWRCPEPNFAAALCVPISGPTSLLGALWMLADHPRGFNDQETHLAEIIAGRIASDLQCEALLDEAVRSTRLSRQLRAAEQSQQNRLPQIAPLADGWELAGDSRQQDQLGGAFHDWFTLDENTLALVAGYATPPGVEGALAAVDLRATVRAHAASQHNAADLLQRVEGTIARGSAGDRRDHLCYALLDADMGRVRYATAGAMGVMVVGRKGWQSLGQPSATLGDPTGAPREQQMWVLSPGESLVIYNRAMLGDPLQDTSSKTSIEEATLAAWLSNAADTTAAAKIERLRQQCDALDAEPARVDRTVLVARHRG